MVFTEDDGWNMENKTRERWYVSRIVLVITALLLVFSCTGLAEAEDTWTCPECGRTGNTGIFCGNCAHPSPAPKQEPVKIGDLVILGRYEQDNNTNNGRDAVEWIVLDVDKKDHKALLLSRYGLRGRPYNTEKTDITWENCTLRSWLNDKFYPAVFTKKEQAAILETQVDNSSSQGYGGWNTRGGRNTKDKIFLLSCAEANSYLGVKYLSWNNNEESRVAPTAYAIAHGAFINNQISAADGGAAGWWWLRSPGNSQNCAAYVLYDGSLRSNSVQYDDGVVRPALWINLESDIF